MPEGWLEMAALGLRYLYALLGVLIVVTAFIWLFRDRRATHALVRNLPDAGLIGRMVVESNTEQLPRGTEIDVPWEGVIGSTRTADVYLPCEGVRGRHLDFFFHEGEGLEVIPRRGLTCVVDGVEYSPAGRPRSGIMGEGSLLRVGDAEVRLYIFAGLNMPREARMSDDALAAPGTERPQKAERGREHGR